MLLEKMPVCTKGQINLTFIVPSGSGRVCGGRWCIPGLHEDRLPPFPACHNVPFNMDSRRERSLHGPQQRPHWHVDGVREGGGPGLQPAELKVLRWWQGCGRGDTWLLINGGALEGQGSSTVEKCACACCMLGVQEAGPVRQWGMASKGCRSEGQKASYSACLFTFSYCWS